MHRKMCIRDSSYTAMLAARQQAAEAEKQTTAVVRSGVREEYVAGKQSKADDLSLIHI